MHYFSNTFLLFCIIMQIHADKNSSNSSLLTSPLDLYYTRGSHWKSFHWGLNFGTSVMCMVGSVSLWLGRTRINITSSTLSIRVSIIILVALIVSSYILMDLLAVWKGRWEWQCDSPSSLVWYSVWRL